MTKQGHRKTGVGIALVAAVATEHLFGWAHAVIVGVCAMLSSSLPDNMEIKWWTGGERHSVIPHRTLTHWMPMWLALAAWIGWRVAHGQVLVQPEADAALLGICAGALGHVLMDWMTPMGVPVGLLPWRRRSLRLLRSGSGAENMMAVIVFLAGVGLALLSV